MSGLPPGLVQPPQLPAEGAAAAHEPEGGVLGQLPGTMILVIVFFVAFITYYFVNWKLLSFLWRIG